MSASQASGSTRALLKRLLFLIVIGLGLLSSLFAFWVYWANQHTEGTSATSSASIAESGSALVDSRLVDRGAYLARAGNCAACHSAPGKAEYAGGRALETPFGTTYSSNLTADEKTGLGTWTSNDFWRAMHFGRSKDGRLLSPVFPYASYTKVSREDSDALFAFLRSLTPTTQTNRSHELRFPYNSQAALAVWRALYFKPGTLVARAEKSPAWNRGAYLVEGLGHCGDCHSPRSALGGVQNDTDQAAYLSGGVMPTRNWYAPSLRTVAEAGLQAMKQDEAVKLLKHGVNNQGAVIGPMAEVVYRSTQYLSETDLAAMLTYLNDLPGVQRSSQNLPITLVTQATEKRRAPATANRNEGGQKLYETHCADCHGDLGQGGEQDGLSIYPALAGNRAVLMDSTLNLVQIVVQGGFPPATAGNPRPFGMPPFSHTLSDSEMAQVLSFIRQAWGNEASAVYALDVAKARR